MNTAQDLDDLLETLKISGLNKAEQIKKLAEACLGLPYVYGAYGQLCTPANRKKYASYHPEYKDDIYKPCPVLSGKQATCDGCKWDGCRCFDCRGFTMWLLSQVGIQLYGGGATTQYETNSNWAYKGDIRNMPQNLVCCLFKHRENRMSHTGEYLGNGNIIHCSGIVKEDSLPGKPAWTNFGIPAGLYTDEELKAAGIDPSRNVATLRKGAEGDLVLDLQRALVKAGSAPADFKVDGKFGKATEEAVKVFQTVSHLTSDGVVGPKTWKALAPYMDAPPVDEDEDVYTDDRTCWERLYNVIENPYGVAGVMGNLCAESGINPKNLENTGNKNLNISDEAYTQDVDTGIISPEQFANDGYGYGIAQWTYHSRKEDLLNYAFSNDYTIGCLPMQVDFLLQEMGGYVGLMDSLKNAKSVREASDTFYIRFEHSGDGPEETKAKRAKLGQQYFDEFANTVDFKPAEPPQEDKPIESMGAVMAALKAAYASAKTACDILRKLIEGE